MWESDKWEGGMFLVLFKDGGCRVIPKFHLCVFDVNQGNKRSGWNCQWNCMYLFEKLYLRSSNVKKWGDH